MKTNLLKICLTEIQISGFDFFRKIVLHKHTINQTPRISVAKLVWKVWSQSWSTNYAASNPIQSNPIQSNPIQSNQLPSSSLQFPSRTIFIFFLIFFTKEEFYNIFSFFLDLKLCNLLTSISIWLDISILLCLSLKHMYM